MCVMRAVSVPFSLNSIPRAAAMEECIRLATCAVDIPTIGKVVDKYSYAAIERTRTSVSERASDSAAISAECRASTLARYTHATLARLVEKVTRGLHDCHEHVYLVQSAPGRSH